MATSNAKLVSAGKPKRTGAVYSAPMVTGVNLPTDAAASLDTEFVGLGYCGKDGASNKVETSSTDIEAWGGDVVLTIQGSRKETLTFTLIQSLDPDVLKEVNGQQNVTVTTQGAITVKHNSIDLPNRIYVVDMLLTGGRTKRLVVPNGKITEVGEVTYKDENEIAYQCTVTCYPNSDGDTVLEYISAPAAG